MIFDRYRFNEQLAMELGEKILLAIVALIVTWLAAKAAKWAFAKLVDTVDFFKRGTGSGQSLGESLGPAHQERRHGRLLYIEVEPHAQVIGSQAPRLIDNALNLRSDLLSKFADPRRHIKKIAW